jgi:uncharacterized membrane protein
MQDAVFILPHTYIYRFLNNVIEGVLLYKLIRQHTVAETFQTLKFDFLKTY